MSRIARSEHVATWQPANVSPATESPPEPGQERPPMSPTRPRSRPDGGSPGQAGVDVSVMTIRVSKDTGRSWGRRRRFLGGAGVGAGAGTWAPLVTMSWPPCRCPGCTAAARSRGATGADRAVAAITQAARAEAIRCPRCRQERRVSGSEVVQGGYRPVVVTGTCACSGEDGWSGDDCSGDGRSGGDRGEGRC
jgi:hypothetical protein